MVLSCAAPLCTVLHARLPAPAAAPRPPISLVPPRPPHPPPSEPAPAAWSQRLFVLHNAPVAAVGPPSEAYDREVDFTARTLRLAPHNESGWEALRALMGAHPGAPRRALAADPRPLGLCREVLAGTPGCAPALSLLGDVLLEAAALLRDAARLLGSDGGPTAAATGRALDAKAAQVAAAAAQRLAREALERQLAADPMKRPFLGAELAAVDAALAAGT